MAANPNPYASPGAPVADRDAAEFRFSVALIGMLVACGVAYVLGLVYGNIAQWALFSRGTSLDNLYEAVASSAWFNVGAHVINVFGAAVGGYWAASLGPQRATVHALVAGACMLVPVLIAWITPYQVPHPGWSIVLSFITPIPSALVGALWCLRR